MLFTPAHDLHEGKGLVCCIHYRISKFSHPLCLKQSKYSVFTDQMNEWTATILFEKDKKLSLIADAV